MRAILVLPLLLAFAAPPRPEHWVQLFSANGLSISIDLPSLKKNGDRRSYALKHTSPDGSYEVDQMDEDCVANTAVVKRMAFYTSGGALVSDEAFGGPVPTMRFVHSVVCQ